MLERTLAIREKALGQAHPSVAASLADLGRLQLYLGGLGEARELFERVLEIQERVLGPEDSRVARSLTNLAAARVALGDLEEARSLFERALAIDEKALGPWHSAVANDLDNLAATKLLMRDYAQARPLLERSLAIDEKALGPWHRNIATELNNLAMTRYFSGDTTAALSLLERALAIREKALGPEHPEVAQALHNLAAIRHSVLDDTTAKRLLERSLAIRVNTLGPDHPDVAQTLAGLAALQTAVGESRAALRTALQAEALGRAHFEMTAMKLSQQEALGYATIRAGGRDAALSLCSVGAVDGAEDSVFDAVIHARALVLDELASRSRALGEVGTGTSALRRRLAEASAEYASIVVRGPDTARPERFREELGQARRRYEAAEQALGSASVEFRKAKARRRIGLAQVQAALPPGSALVAFVRYGMNPVAQASRRQAAAVRGESDRRQVQRGEWAPAYLAFILGPSHSKARVIPLGSASELDLRVRRWQLEASLGRAETGRL